MYGKDAIIMLSRISKIQSYSDIKKCTNLLDQKDQVKILFVVFINIFLGFLDLLGIAMFGILGALTVSGISAQPSGSRVQSVVKLFGLSNFNLQSQVIIIGSFATLILIARTLFSIFSMRRTLFFLSRRSAVISGKLISKLLSQPLLTIQARPTQQTLYAVTDGVTSITVGVIGALVALISDFTLLFIIGIGLLVVDPFLALGTFILFSFVGFVIYRILSNKASRLGAYQSELNIASNEKILEVLTSYRELVVRNRRHYYLKGISEIRFNLSNAQAEISFMPFISKYVFEIAIVFGALFISGFQFIFSGTVHAVATLSIFLVAGSRIAPAILRIQQGLLGVNGSLGAATPTLDFISSNKIDIPLIQYLERFDTYHNGFKPYAELSNVSMQYSTRNSKALSGINLKVDQGSVVALVGPSGAGKTTLVDVLLGVITPTEGSVVISDVSPSDAISIWPGAISYLPQDIQIINGTIRQNISMGFPENIATDDLVLEALRLSNLEEFVKQLPLGIDSYIGERGAKLSGGQRQRLGIARALFTKPKILVMDEATSALDHQTEISVSDSIINLREEVTIVFIAHRLSTVKKADQIVYINEGKILSKGSFEKVRSEVPEFEKNSKLAGF